MDGLFFDYRVLENRGRKLRLSRDCEVIGEDGSFAAGYARRAAASFPATGDGIDIILSMGYPESLVAGLGDRFAEHKESYAIRIKKDGTYLYALTRRGLIYAVSTLIRLVVGDCVTDDLTLFDYPDMDIRGYRVFTPGRDHIPAFKAVIDRLVDYKYNCVIIEVGGAMEYKRRPEINEEWVRFCKEISSSKGAASRIKSHTYPWRKNSIHFDNGDGGFITQNQMRELIEYCRQREIDVIPEVPTLSHSDYIVRTYRDLNERIEDEYPDTYCPSKPETYEVVFDIIDEVIEVFEPEYINIGHDEYYTAAQCTLCRGKSPVDLYVEDIKRINDYLKSKNVKALMWADKFFGDPVTGNAYPAKMVPDLLGCRGKVPADIALLNWAWQSDVEDQERLLVDLGYELIFGNFDAISCPDYRKRKGLHRGGIVSNWGSLAEEYIQRNLQDFWLADTAFVFWSAGYTNADAPALLEKVRRELYGAHKRSLGDRVIEICHTVGIRKQHVFFWDGLFIEPSEFKIGDHTVRYDDGTEAKLPVIYGYNIRQSGIPDFESDVGGDAIEALGASYPFIRDGEVWYRTCWADPYPQKSISSVDPAPGVRILREN